MGGGTGDRPVTEGYEGDHDGLREMRGETPIAGPRRPGTPSPIVVRKVREMDGQGPRGRPEHLSKGAGEVRPFVDGRRGSRSGEGERGTRRGAANPQSGCLEAAQCTADAVEPLPLWQSLSLPASRPGGMRRSLVAAAILVIVLVLVGSVYLAGPSLLNTQSAGTTTSSTES